MFLKMKKETLGKTKYGFVFIIIIILGWVWGWIEMKKHVMCSNNVGDFGQH